MLSWPPSGTQGALQPQATHNLLRPECLAERTSPIHRTPQCRQFRLPLRHVHLLQPVRQSPQRPSGQQFLLLGSPAMPAVKTAPAPVLRTPHQVGPQGVPLHVTADRKEVLVILDGEGLEPALIKVSRATVVPICMPPLGVSQRQPSSESRQLTIPLRPDDQVPMRGHDTIGQQSRLRSFHGFRKNPLEGCKIFGLLEDRHPRVSAVENMINQSAVRRSSWSSHNATLWTRSFPVELSDSKLSFLHTKRFLTPFQYCTHGQY